MAKRAIGVDVEGFRQSPKEALRTASRLGFGPVEVSASGGEISPEQLGESGRRHLRRYVEGLGLSLAALGADLGGQRFADRVGLDERLDRTRRILEMAAEMRVPVVTARVGPIRAGGDPRTDVVVEAVRQIADHADMTSTYFAIETADTSPEVLAAFLDQIDCPFVRAAYDPAALLMQGDDPVAAVETLAEHIRFLFARDAVEGRPERPGHETALGAGQVDVTRVFDALEQAGFSDSPIMRRVYAQRPVEEFAAARARLERALRR